MSRRTGPGFPVRIRRIVDPVAARRDAVRRFGPPVAVWRRDDDALHGYGVAARLAFAGPDRISDAARAWRALADRAEADGDVAGIRPLAFGAFTFSATSAAPSVLLVPRLVVGERAGTTYTIESPELEPPSATARPLGAVGRPASAFGADAYRAAVARAVTSIRAGALEKVVLARDVPVDAPGFDLPAALDELTDRYRGSWIFAVDGLFGASPETLITVDGGAATSRVLAGTAQRNEDPAVDTAARAQLLESPKNRFEHALAVDSLLLTLGGAVDDLELGRPFALELPNVWHLATDATARVRAGFGALDLVALLHPTAAVAGAPRATALRLIAELETFDRRRYAGPVGWIDADGDGEWAIGLRSAEVEGPDLVRAYAGAGVVAASDPEQELAETAWKLAPVLDALAAVAAPPLTA